MTPRALSCLAQAQVVIGHKNCLELVSAYLKDKTLIEDHMSPLERSRLAAEKACSGEIVAILSTGHPGTYAIASTFFGYLQQYGLKVDTEVIPGLTLADYASAKLGSRWVMTWRPSAWRTWRARGYLSGNGCQRLQRPILCW